MNNNREELEFDILGYKVKFRPEEDEGNAPVEKVAEYICNQADEIMSKSPNIDKGQILLLIALKAVKEKMDLEIEYKDNLSQLQMTASDALQFIEEVSPSTNV